MDIEEDYPRTRVSERPRNKKEAKDFKNQMKQPWDDIPVKVLVLIMLGLIYLVFR
tara:strand:- start:720 stop:884 length:165 start_codon:yes stop_codon:yes gene_type:complete